MLFNIHNTLQLVQKPAVNLCELPNVINCVTRLESLREKCGMLIQPREKKVLWIGETHLHLQCQVTMQRLKELFFLKTYWVTSKFMIYDLSGCSVQSSPLTEWVIWGTWGAIQRRSSSKGFQREAIMCGSGKDSHVHSFTLPSISSANHGISHPPGCYEGWFWRGCCGVWHTKTKWISVSWQLLKEAPVGPKGNQSCSTPSC